MKRWVEKKKVLRRTVATEHAEWCARIVTATTHDVDYLPC